MRIPSDRNRTVCPHRSLLFRCSTDNAPPIDRLLGELEADDEPCVVVTALEGEEDEDEDEDELWRLAAPE